MRKKGINNKEISKKEFIIMEEDIIYTHSKTKRYCLLSENKKRKHEMYNKYQCFKTALNRNFESKPRILNKENIIKNKR